jgi:hypothetical protein
MSLLAILYGQKIVDSQQGYYDDLKSELESKGVSVALASDLSTNPDIQNALAVSKINLKENSFAVFEINGDKTKFVDYKNNISSSLNWIETFGQFADNYADDQPEGDYWRWGQIVPETGDYLCKDCGYIAEFQQGDIFPICEVCQAGEPDGPSTPDQGYWERV